MKVKLFSFIFILSLFSVCQAIDPQNKPSAALPLHTASRWIVDENGQRVKFACVNWPAHLETVVPEGLGLQPVDRISRMISSLGFNCVRLTYPTYLLTDDAYADITVRQSFLKYGLIQSLAGCQANNPDIIDLPLLSAFKAVVSSLGKQNVMVILDNHLSKPGWCCSDSDGNGFFGDQYFDPNDWIKGLSLMAATFHGVSHVVGMSLRNELRGHRQNVTDWFRYMQEGAEAVHEANPDVLVALSGLGYDTDLSFLGNQSLNLTFSSKLVYEVHRYSFTSGNDWGSTNANEMCSKVVDSIMSKTGFVMEQGYPLFVSEFGVNIQNLSAKDERFLNCFNSFLAEHDLDWAIWGLQGSYYLRQGQVGLDEHFGVLSWNWYQPGNSSFMRRLSALQTAFRGPGLESPHKVLFHPSTGLCAVARRSLPNPLVLGPCSEAAAWIYTTEKTLTLMDTNTCLQASIPGHPAVLAEDCSANGSIWEIISASKLYLSVQGQDPQLCLDKGHQRAIVLKPCKCLAGDSQCNPASQWFKLVDRARGPAS